MLAICRHHRIIAKEPKPSLVCIHEHHQDRNDTKYEVQGVTINKAQGQPVQSTDSSRCKTNRALAARYTGAQIACIMNMQRQGVAPKDVSAVFRLALSVFV